MDSARRLFASERTAENRKPLLGGRRDRTRADKLVDGRALAYAASMSSDDDFDDAVSALPIADEVPATLDAVVDEARKYSHFALRELIKVAQGKGGRGAQARAGAARMILEIGRFVGSDSEEHKPKKQSALPNVAPVPNTPEQEALRAKMRAELIRRRQQASQQ